MLWKEIWESHRGRIIGVAAGIFFGFIYLLAGFWDMLFFALVVFIGYTAGKRKDSKLGSFFRWSEMGQWLSERWRPFK
ncbi:DUF2273 domain-containing protein [Paenibacillus sp. SAF-054]|uniref:DUF2273 domain-containing protein n=1 Tax=unclassified Paenibacillus TaxID=185978 RepID=UPI003F819660